MTIAIHEQLQMTQGLCLPFIYLRPNCMEEVGVSKGLFLVLQHSFLLRYGDFT